MTSEAAQRFCFLPTWLQARWENYIGVGEMVCLAGSFYLESLWAGLRRGHLGVLFGRTNHEVRDQAFANFYQAVSHNFADRELDSPVPALVASAHGVVLELGPATGNQLERFDAARIEHVYGVEPNTGFARAFAARLGATRLGQDGKYTLVPCGVEDEAALAGYGLAEGTVDCVLSIQVMCSLPKLEAQVQNMYRLLKPGGELLFWEHTRSSDVVTRAVQWLWCLLWPSVVGGCRLDSVSRDAIVKAADWEVVDVHADMEPHMMLPRLWGRLVKPQAA